MRRCEQLWHPTFSVSVDLALGNCGKLTGQFLGHFIYAHPVALQCLD
jgi:hypothetical protein